MSERSEQHEPEPPAMHHREITLADGRYMVFYTFGETAADADPVAHAPDSSPANTDV